MVGQPEALPKLGKIKDHALLRRLGWPNFFVRVINWLGWAAGMSLVLKLQLYGGLAWADTAWLLAIPRAFRDILFTFRPELLILAGSGVIWWMGRRVACARAGFHPGHRVPVRAVHAPGRLFLRRHAEGYPRP